MKPDPHLQELIAAKRQWSEPLRPEETARGFKGWYSSKYLPHFDAPGTQQFITYRLANSVPVALRGEWEATLALDDDAEKRKRIEVFLDRGLGECHLRNPRVAELVQANLWHHDGRKYRLLAWVIMPNHVHVLVELWQTPLSTIVKSWKSYTAKEANKMLRRQGAFWAEDYFDRYVRDEAHFNKVRRYIEQNAMKAGLARAPEDWPWCSARYRGREDTSARALTPPGAERVAPAPVEGEGERGTEV